MFSDVQHRVKKAGQPPGTAVYTGKKTEKAPVFTIATFDAEQCQVVSGHEWEKLSWQPLPSGITWINVEGLADVPQIKALADRFGLHPLTVEDILNVEQRPKVEEFENYLFVTLKVLRWKNKKLSFSIRQVGIIIGKDFVLSFLELDNALFDGILTKLQSTNIQRLRQQKADYLAYRMIDSIVDDYFVVLEGLGEEIEILEARVVTDPTPQNVKTIYHLKRQILILRKAIWPMREAVNHMQYAEDTLISQFTRIYLRDVYDHIMQAMDTIETFRDMLSSMLDMYLSGLTIRMNEIMKTLTIITTIFIPITALASIYGMNLPDIPLMKSRFGFAVVSVMMIMSVTMMIVYFRRKKWV